MSNAQSQTELAVELWDTPVYHVQIPDTHPMHDKARQLAADMGALHGSIEDGDGNFAGLLAELAFCDVFDAERSATYERDVVRNGVSIDVKTKRRSVRPEPEYEASIADYNTEQDADGYYFTSYNTETNVLSLLGYIGTDDYYNQSEFHKAGEIDEDNDFEFKADCYNLEYKHLKQCELPNEGDN